jgi:phosphoesterase RecJ-like protein
MIEAQFQAIHTGLREANHILIACHMRPDGDAIGSLLGLGLALQDAGKRVQMVSVDGVPQNLRFLAGSDQISTQAREPFDIFVTVDCSEAQRAGISLDDRQPDINIDHHITNESFADLNLIEPGAVATAEILARALPIWELSISKPSAEALLTGIVTDTLGFRTTNMNPEVLRLAADLMQKGADLPGLYRRTLIQQSFEAIRYWAAGLSRLGRTDRIVWATFTLADRKAAGYPGKDDADLINVLSSIDGCDIAIVFVEQTHSRVKVSWRAQAGWDVSRLAQGLGGGGHPAASGAELQGSIDDVCSRVLVETQNLVRQMEIK